MDGLAEGRGVWEGTVFPFSRAGSTGYPLRRPGERLGTLGRNRSTAPTRPEARAPPMDGLAEGRGVWEGTVFPFSRAGSTGYPLRRPRERLGTLGRNRSTAPSRPEARGPPMDGLAEGRGVWEGTVFPFSRAGIQGYPLRRPGERLGTLGRNRPTAPTRPEARGPPMDGLAEGRGVWEGTVFPFSRAGSTGSPHGRASRRPRGLGRNRFSLQPCRKHRVPLRRPGERLGTLGRNRSPFSSRPEAVVGRRTTSLKRCRRSCRGWRYVVIGASSLLGLDPKGFVDKMDEMRSDKT